MQNKETTVRFTIRIGMVLFFVITLNIVSIGYGGTDSIPNFHQVNPWLYRGGAPEAAGVEKLAKLGIKTIVDLEGGWFKKEPSEIKVERQWAGKAGMKFFHVPMHPLFSPKIKDIDKALAYIADPHNKPVFVHCERGSDRTGIVIAAYRIKIEKWTVPQAYKEMKACGYRRWLLFWWKNLLYKLDSFGQK